MQCLSNILMLIDIVYFFFYLSMGIFKQLGGKGFIVFKGRFSVN